MSLRTHGERVLCCKGCLFLFRFLYTLLLLEIDSLERSDIAPTTHRLRNSHVQNPQRRCLRRDLFKNKPGRV